MQQRRPTPPQDQGLDLIWGDVGLILARLRVADHGTSGENENGAEPLPRIQSFIQ